MERGRKIQFLELRKLEWSEAGGKTSKRGSGANARGEPSLVDTLERKRETLSVEESRRRRRRCKGPSGTDARRTSGKRRRRHRDYSISKPKLREEKPSFPRGS